MLSIAITGGIACGKSTVVKTLAELLGEGRVAVFSCDEAVSQLLARTEIQGEVSSCAPGESLFGKEGFDKSALRKLAFENSEFRGKLEALLHPLVLSEAESFSRSSAGKSAFALFEVPLLYEVEFPLPRAMDLVVGASEATQIRRLREARGLSEGQSRRMLEAQLLVSQKAERAQMVVWNDGGLASLQDQVKQVAIRIESLLEERMTEEPLIAADAAPPEDNRDDRREESEAPAVEVPERLDVNQFQQRRLADLQHDAQEAGLRVAGVRSKHQLVFDLLKFYGSRGTKMEAEGFLEVMGDNQAFLRWPEFSFASNADDVYVHGSLVKRFQLRPGQRVRCTVNAPQKEKLLSAGEIIEIEGIPVAEWTKPPMFDQLTALFPTERLILELTEGGSPSSRVIDLVAPLGKGQRGLIVAPPRGGKTILLKNIAVSIHKNNPEVELIVMLLDERPEEVTDFRETVNASIYSSTFDEPSHRHVEVADMVLNRAKRIVEMGKDVVVLLDSLTRLARAHNSANQSGNPAGKRPKGRPGGGGGGGGGGPIGSGGISPKALERSRKFFGAARNVDEGGSLTILATCLIETDSRMDDVIFEEFKGTGNMEVVLDREMAEARIFPAIHLLKSGTRKDELLYHPEEFQRVSSLRRQMVQMPAPEAMGKLLKTIHSTSSNAELLLRGIQ